MRYKRAWQKKNKSLIGLTRVTRYGKKDVRGFVRCIRKKGISFQTAFANFLYFRKLFVTILFLMSF